MSGTTALALLFPAGALDLIWHPNPHAHEGVGAMGQWSVALMTAVSVACASCSRGLITAARWGWRLALGLLAVNLPATH